jgi:predicted Zn-dependent protease
MQAIESDVPQVRPLEVDVMTIEQGATVPARSVGASSKPRAVGASQSPDKRKRVALKSVKVRPGDSLSSLAKRHGVGVDRLKQLNNLRGSKVFAGQTLLVPK